MALFAKKLRARIDEQQATIDELGARLTTLTDKASASEIQVAVKEGLLEQRLEEVKHLRSQVERLQDAYLAVQHPVAYRQVKEDQYDAQNPQVDETFSKESRQRKEWQDKYLDSLEGPIFDSADQMIETLQMVDAPRTIEPKSVHGNTES
jgi:predicted  nucleic acid-binding Zn-ribbon protein